MMQLKFLRSTPLRLAFSIIICGTFVGIFSLYISFEFLENSMNKKMHQKMENEISVFEDAQSKDELINLVRSMARMDSLVRMGPIFERRIFNYSESDGISYGNGLISKTPDGLKLVTSPDYLSGGQNVDTSVTLTDLERTVRIMAYGPRGFALGQFYVYTSQLFDGKLTFALPCGHDRLHKQFETIMILSVLPTMFIVLLFGALYAFGSSRRISEINKILNELASGNLKARIKKKPGFPDDLSTISINVNEMAASHQNAAEIVKQISSDIAHDLRTPIQKIQILIDEAKSMDKLPDGVEALLKRTRKETDDVLSTFNSLLQIAQIEGIYPPDNFKEVDIRELTKKIIELYEPSAEESGHFLHHDISELGSHVIMGNENLLGIALSNVIENALRHTPFGTKMTVRLEADSTQVRLVISDTGPGIPREYHRLVVRRLYRMDTSRQISGSGLGLSTVAAVMKVHSGELELSCNEPGLNVHLSFYKLGYKSNNSLPIIYRHQT